MVESRSRGSRSPPAPASPAPTASTAPNDRAWRTGSPRSATEHAPHAPAAIWSMIARAYRRQRPATRGWARTFWSWAVHRRKGSGSHRTKGSHSLGDIGPDIGRVVGFILEVAKHRPRVDAEVARRLGAVPVVERE